MIVKQVQWSSKGSRKQASTTQTHDEMTTNSCFVLLLVRTLCLSRSSCSKDIYWKVSEKALPAFPALEQRREKCNQKKVICAWNLKMIFCFLLRLSAPRPICPSFLSAFSQHVTLYSLSLLFPSLPPPLHPTSLSLIPPVSLVPQESC